MDIRNLENLNIDRAIIHILDNKEDKLVLNDFELNLDNTKINDLFKKHIKNSVNNEGTRIARFLHEINVVKEQCRKILEDEESNFINSSKEIAKQLFDSMNKPQISSANFAVCIYSTDSGKYVALLKLDFSENIETKVVEENGKTKIELIVKGKGVPSAKEKLQKCVFIKEIEEDSEYDMVLLDRQAKKEKNKELVADFFWKEFLHCELSNRPKDLNRNFKRESFKFIEDNFKDNPQKAGELKNLVVNIFKNANEIIVNDFADLCFSEEPELKNNFINTMSERVGDFTIPIDKEWVNKNLSKKIYKTNTGIDIQVEVDVAEDEDKFEIRYKEDKTCDIIIKNVIIEDENVK